MNHISDCFPPVNAQFTPANVHQAVVDKNNPVDHTTDVAKEMGKPVKAIKKALIALMGSGINLLTRSILVAAGLIFNTNRINREKIGKAKEGQLDPGPILTHQKKETLQKAELSHAIECDQILLDQQKKNLKGALDATSMDKIEQLYQFHRDFAHFYEMARQSLVDHGLIEKFNSKMDDLLKEDRCGGPGNFGGLAMDIDEVDRHMQGFFMHHGLSNQYLDARGTMMQPKKGYDWEDFMKRCILKMT